MTQNTKSLPLSLVKTPLVQHLCSCSTANCPLFTTEHQVILRVAQVSLRQFITAWAATSAYCKAFGRHRCNIPFRVIKFWSNSGPLLKLPLLQFAKQKFRPWIFTLPVKDFQNTRDRFLQNRTGISCTQAIK